MNMRIVTVIFKIDLVSILLEFLYNFFTIPIMNPLSWFMINYILSMTCVLCTYFTQYPIVTATLKDIGDDPLLIDQRKQQIDQRRKQYTWKRYPDSGLPSSIDLGTISLPVDEEFHRAKAVNFLGNTFRGLVINGKLVNPTLKAIDDNIRKLLGVITHADFQTVNDLYIFEVFPLRLWKNEELNHKQSSEITKGFEMQICQGSRWVTDEEFGRQILNGVNPVMISRCSALPDNFPVTNDMVKNFLIRNMSLEEEMKVC